MNFLRKLYPRKRKEPEPDTYEHAVWRMKYYMDRAAKLEKLLGDGWEQETAAHRRGEQAAQKKIEELELTIHGIEEGSAEWEQEAKLAKREVGELTGRAESAELLLVAQRCATAALEGMVRRFMKTAPYAELITDSNRLLATVPTQHLAAIRKAQQILEKGISGEVEVADVLASLEDSFGRQL